MSAQLSIISTMLRRNPTIMETQSFASCWWQLLLLFGRVALLWSDRPERHLWVIGSPAIWLGTAAGLLL
jgi:hypothetical protein